MAAKVGALLLGKCVPCVKPYASKICVSKMELDVNLRMYFKNFTYVYAHDPAKMCKTGDIVLIEELPEKITKLITHSVKQVVHPCGDAVDPITNNKIISTEFREDIIEKSKLYGRNLGAFDYDKAPSRGWQEGIKDFSDRETYDKYHESGEEQPYAL